MKKYWLIILFYYIGFCTTYAQAKQDSLLLITYKLTVSFAGTPSAESYETLIIDGNTSYFSFYDVPEDMTRFWPQIIKKHEEQTMFFYGAMPPKYNGKVYWVDSLAAMKWALGNKTKTINKFICHDAYTFFRGRRYTAWYAPDFPIADGPWKFAGLPGLIVQVYDEKRDFEETMFEFRKIANLIKIKIDKVEGNYAEFKPIFKSWRSRKEAAESARQGIDPNCVDCASVKNRSKQREID